MNNKDLGEPSSRISQIRKEKIDEMLSLAKLSTHVSIFDKNDITEITKNHPKIDPDDPRLPKEPPSIAPPKIRPILQNPALNLINAIKTLVDLSYEILLVYRNHIIAPTECVTVGSNKIKISGYEKEGSITLTVACDEVEVFYKGKSETEWKKHL